MREIKFRAWDKKLLHMYYDQDNEKEPNLWNIKDNIRGGKLINNNCILMQYTGLKDKNGKEIYEGDILTLSNWTSNQYRKGNPITIYKVRIPGIFYEDCDEQIGKRDGEVIGNIYENPELLDNKQKGNK